MNIHQLEDLYGDYSDGCELGDCVGSLAEVARQLNRIGHEDKIDLIYDIIKDIIRKDVQYSLDNLDEEPYMKIRPEWLELVNGQ